eukprot:m.3008 g.3008  ORF g.3008 m.3008 type:complete len:95 (+) comp2464_c0_seq1:29-313(+)
MQPEARESERHSITATALHTSHFHIAPFNTRFEENHKQETAVYNKQYFKTVKYISVLRQFHVNAITVITISSLRTSNSRWYVLLGLQQVSVGMN